MRHRSSWLGATLSGVPLSASHAPQQMFYHAPREDVVSSDLAHHDDVLHANSSVLLDDSPGCDRIAQFSFFYTTPPRLNVETESSSAVSTSRSEVAGLHSTGTMTLVLPRFVRSTWSFWPPRTNPSPLTRARFCPADAYVSSAPTQRAMDVIFPSAAWGISLV